MTLIVAKITDTGTVWMGGDSAGVSGMDLYIRKDPKVFYKKGYVIGFTTSFRFGQIVRHHVSLPPIEEACIMDIIEIIIRGLSRYKYLTEKDKQIEGGRLIIGWKDHLYIIDTDFQYIQPTLPYCCIGCGSDYGLGAMFVEHRFKPRQSTKGQLLNALWAGTLFSTGVAPPFIILNTEGDYKEYPE